MGLPVTSEDKQVREEIMGTTFIVQFFPVVGDENAVEVVFTEIKKDGSEQMKIDIHELISNESSYWGCVNSKKAEVGLATAVMLCLNQ